MPSEQKRPSSKRRVVHPMLDNFLTLIFFLELLYMLVTFAQSGDLTVFLIALVCSGIGIVLIRYLFGLGAVWFSRTFLQSLGMVSFSNSRRPNER